ncbi:MAG: homocysteine S-methyltransferase family protein, partial [Hyphococcus sp.]
MSIYRHALPQVGDDIFLTDGGLETDLVFNHGFDLPCFAAFHLLKSPEGRAALRAYYERHAAIATRHGHGFILEAPTWRANPDWAAKLGYDYKALAAANEDAIAFMCALRDNIASARPMVVSGCIGPRADGYDPGVLMTKEEAEAYHSFQADVFAATDANMIAAVTMTNTPEAIGVSRAASAAKMPVAISFTVETDGRLPTGQPLGEAIMEVDFESATPPAYYMINCAHPTHFDHVLREGGPWLTRLRGVRANASKCSHAELDESETLDAGDPAALGAENVMLRKLVPCLSIIGGCCGT